MIQYLQHYFQGGIGSKDIAVHFWTLANLAISGLDHVQIFDFAGILTVGVILFIYILRMTYF